MFNFNQEKSYFKKFNNQTIVLTEQVNTKKLKYIVDNFEEFFKGFSDEEIREWFKQDANLTEMEATLNIEEKKKLYHTKLSNYLRKTRNGKVKIIYKQTSLNRGRYFCEGGSLQNHMRQFRHTIADEFYYDLDFKNCHPKLLYQYCEKNGIPCKELKQYATDRDTYLAYVSKMKYYQTKDSQKRYLLRMVNGGCKKCYVEELKPLYEELKTIRMLIYNTNPDIKNYVHKNYKCKKEHESITEVRDCEICWNAEGKVTNHIMCDLENQCILTFYNILEQNEMKTDVDCFDGLMIRKQDVYDTIGVQGLNELLKFCEEQIYKTIGYKVEIEKKAMDEGFDIKPELYKDIDISLYESDLTEEDIKEFVKKCVYGENSEYADFLYAIYGKENIKVYDSVKGELHLYHWNSTKKLHEKETSSKMLKYIRLLSPHFQNEIDILTKRLKRLEKGKDEYKELKQTINAYKKAQKRLSATSFKKGVIQEYGAFDFDDEIENKMNKSPDELPIKDGRIINIKTGQIRKRTKNDLWSFELDLKFKDATNDHLYDEYISSLFKDPETEEYVKKWVSYLLTGNTFHRKFYVLHGIGCNGKSVFMDMVQSLLSNNLYKTLSEQAIVKQRGSRGGATPELVSLRTPRLAVMNELNDNTEIDSAMVKRLTGGDELTVRPLYKEEITFKTQSKICIITNELPNFDISDQAMLDRVVFIPFKQRFTPTPESRDYLNSLKNDKDALFSYFVRQYPKFLKEGLEVSKLMKEASKNYLAELNDVAEFIDENYEIINETEYENGTNEEKEKLKILPKDVWTHYCEYCIENKQKRKTKPKFNKILTDMGILTKRNSKNKHYILKPKMSFGSVDVEIEF